MLTLSAAVGLLAAMLLFVGHSLGTMSAGAVRSVPIDWQGPVGSYGAATEVAGKVAAQAGVAEAAATATAPFAGIEHVSKKVGTIRAGAGAILAVPPRYLSHINAFRFLRGSLAPGEIVFDQQLAATLQVQPGDTVVLTPRLGAKPVRLRVSGIALVTAPDQLFQPLNPLLGPAPAQPPANIAILPLATFAAKIAPILPSISSATGASAVPGSQAGTQWQVQVQVDPPALTGSPAHALQQATRLRKGVERSLPGQIVFVDNLGDSLNGAAGDALYAETLYIMLAVPGALVALGLAYLAALGTAERDRRNLALLRARAICFNCCSTIWCSLVPSRAKLRAFSSSDFSIFLYSTFCSAREWASSMPIISLKSSVRSRSPSPTTAPIRSRLRPPRNATGTSS